MLNPPRPLAGRHILVTSGPTHEPIDPVRYIANRSSGRQGHAIAAALAALGARVTLVHGPVSVPDPPGVTAIPVETAAQMMQACRAALPADAAVFAAAVADWRVDHAAELKLKKTPGGAPPALALVPNPDILATIAAAGPARPRLVVGFAAETNDVLAHAGEKRRRKYATGSSPTTSARRRASWAEGERSASGDGTRDRGLATPRQARSGRAAGRTHRRGVGMTVPVRVQRLPHGAD